MRNRVSARRRLERGKASNYISSIDNIKRGDKVVLACRVSGREQERRRNLDGYEAHMRTEMERLDAVVVDVVCRQISGFDPYWIGAAVEIAKKHDAKIVALSTNRLIRHPAYHSERCWDAQARTPDLEYLKYWAQGVQLVTVLNPDASPREERSLQTKVGQCAKGRKGGRPTLGEQEKLRREVVKMTRKLPPH